MELNADVNTLLKRSRRWSILLAYTTKGCIASMIWQGSVIGDLFLDFVKNDVLLLCIRAGFKSKNSVIIEPDAMCEEAGVTLARLPAGLQSHRDFVRGIERMH